MIEKPFGRDSASFAALDALTARHFDEDQLFRVDHYLGKEILLNIPTLRWANAIFEPLWSAAHVESVQIIFKENIGTDGRGGYFDGFGIIRDIIQNHYCCRRSCSWRGAARGHEWRRKRRAKVELLRAVAALDLGAGDTPPRPVRAVRRRRSRRAATSTTDGAQAGSRCPTFAACVLRVDNERWRGVPFLLSAGKGLDERLCEFRVRFKPQPFQARLLGCGRAQRARDARAAGRGHLHRRAWPRRRASTWPRAARRAALARRDGMRYATAFGDGSPFMSG